MPPTTELPTAAPVDPVKEAINSANVGDYVKFGVYEQDNDTSNGKEDIEWLVLAKENGKALLISRYLLDFRPYNTEWTDVTWETCTLRTWLNGTFYYSAFSGAEQEQIATTTVTADANPDYDTDPGNDTYDKIFLLSINEANRYFSSDSARQCKTTKYIENQQPLRGKGYDSWWLRSPGSRSNQAAFVWYTGDIDSRGDAVRNPESNGDFVRPALWINLNS